MKGGVRIPGANSRQGRGWPLLLSLSSITYGPKSNDFFPKGRQEELMEKKREVSIGYENEF